MNAKIQMASEMTKREAFAMAALQGLNACRKPSECSMYIAKVAVKDADALIDELNKGESKMGEYR